MDERWDRRCRAITIVVRAAGHFAATFVDGRGGRADSYPDRHPIRAWLRGARRKFASPRTCCSCFYSDGIAAVKVLPEHMHVSLAAKACFVTTISRRTTGALALRVLASRPSRPVGPVGVRVPRHLQDLKRADDSLASSPAPVQVQSATARRRAPLVRRGARRRFPTSSRTRSKRCVTRRRCSSSGARPAYLRGIASTVRLAAASSSCRDPPLAT